MRRARTGASACHDSTQGQREMERTPSRNAAAPETADGPEQCALVGASRVLTRALTGYSGYSQGTLSSPLRRRTARNATQRHDDCLRCRRARRAAPRASARHRPWAFGTADPSQRSTCNMQRTTCNARHATCNMQPTHPPAAAGAIPVRKQCRHEQDHIEKWAGPPNLSRLRVAGCACACVCARARACVCVHACVRSCICVCLCVCVGVSVSYHPIRTHARTRVWTSVRACVRARVRACM